MISLASLRRRPTQEAAALRVPMDIRTLTRRMLIVVVQCAPDAQRLQLASILPTVPADSVTLDSVFRVITALKMELKQT